MTDVAFPRTRRRNAHTKRQLAIIAWTIKNPPPHVSFEEWYILAHRMTQGLSATEQDMVNNLSDAEILKALKRRGSKPWR